MTMADPPPPSETHPMDYYGRIRELEARVAELQAERDEVTVTLSTAVMWTVAPELMAANHKRAAQEAFDALERLRAANADLHSRVAKLEAEREAYVLEAERARARRAAAEGALYRVQHAPKNVKALKNIAKRYFKGRTPTIVATLEHRTKELQKAEAQAAARGLEVGELVGAARASVNACRFDCGAGSFCGQCEPLVAILAKHPEKP